MEGCWNCDSQPVIEEKPSWRPGEVCKRYVCPKCKHSSTAFRDTCREAAVIWNRSARMLKTRQLKAKALIDFQI